MREIAEAKVSMMFAGEVKKSAYFDSITLMQCGKKIAAMDGIGDAAVVMGTNANRAILHSSGLWLGEFDGASDADLLVAVKAENETAAHAALAAVDAILSESGGQSGAHESRPASLRSALKMLPGANLALISIAGRFAGGQARRALQSGLNVMLFSDNVPLQSEIELKELARERGLLMMGPDCGTAIINGVPLAFANVVKRGEIGIVAASGTGMQEASCIISNAGGGISQAIGTGSRDVERQVGGMMMIEALKALAEDENTRVILLISKPPHPEVLERVGGIIGEIGKPVIDLFVGAAKPGGPSTLEEAALMALAVSRGQNPRLVSEQLALRDGEIRQQAGREAAKRRKGQKYLRGLFSGGTFCAEAQALFANAVADVYSNVPAGRATRLALSLESRNNSVVDFGDDEFTVGRPHPMIDYSLRNGRILHEAADPEVAVILLDVILGYGSNPDPASELFEVIREASKTVTVIVSITGTDQDPQDRAETGKRLQEAGALVMPSNAAACKLAMYILQLEGGCLAQIV
jgi:succinyl-CoA synthetase alpha subunit